MIVAAAIRYKGVTFTGRRHSEIISYLVKLPFNYDKTLSEQGFIDHRNNYYCRSESKRLVIECGQHYEPLSSTLTSEDLW